jgi:UDP-N-acetylglucosamine 1-carboxyvinyltransferase
MLASCLSAGTTVITNAAMEPEIVDLQNFLNKMGAQISGAGTNEIKIKGVKKLKDVSYHIMSDRIEAGTFLCAGAITGGNVKLKNIDPAYLTPVIAKLEEAGCNIEVGKSYINLNAPKRLKAVNIKTMPYPGFPTDMQSVLVAVLATAKGTSIIVENIFENRFKYLSELSRMGVKYTVQGNTAIVKGTKKLHGAVALATDLRGGAALVLEGLYAKGVTKIENIEHILRGYEDFDKKLIKLGANISIREGE